ncbi:hypothetical protein NDU88_002009 [Pleurodeles waltl]|uniref:Uncharacterized protein n=1 Tax=Pleurodeles waltl TaxID=8319 RepID=A0AAV7Q5C2_PLEWA|nr:hypothetical protein NDU88_002009 [Pleurodeles waltl]
MRHRLVGPSVSANTTHVHISAAPFSAYQAQFRAGSDHEATDWTPRQCRQDTTYVHLSAATRLVPATAPSGSGHVASGIRVLPKEIS